MIINQTNSSRKTVTKIRHYKWPPDTTILSMNNPHIYIIYNVLKFKNKSLDKKIETILFFKGGPKIQARSNFDRKHWILIKNKLARSDVLPST